MAKKEKHGSFDDLSFAIGQNADGSINSFDLSELPAREAERDRQEKATQFAMDQLAAADISDLDDLDALASVAKKSK